MLQAITNKRSLNIDINERTVKVDGNEHLVDLISLSEGKYLHLLYKQHSYYFEVISFDKDTKTYQLAFDGKTYEINIKDRFDQLLQQMGLDKVNKAKINEIKAPMPGLVLSLKVHENQEIKKGDPILILEAMKMENIIKSPVDGLVKNILVSEKQAVEKNQTLITF